MTNAIQDAYDADKRYAAELVRVYGEKNAGTMRYRTGEHMDPALKIAGLAKVNADRVAFPEIAP